MANKDTKSAEAENSAAEAVKANEGATAEARKPASPASTYAISEISAHPEALGTFNGKEASQDCIAAALQIAGKATVTKEEAKEIVGNYLKKEVK